MFERDGDSDTGGLPVWAMFGDLMACMVGAFVLLFVWLVASQVSLASDLVATQAEQARAEQRVSELELSLARLIGEGRISVEEGGRIGIAGELLFELGSAELTPEGIALLDEIARPLAAYVGDRSQIAMVSGFTDDVPVRGLRTHYADNWELSAQRALTVTRALVAAGVPGDRLFAAGFGQNYPVAPNDSDANRARNRRVHIVPVERVLAVGP